jgi:RNA polymerase sigma-70 factor, ECF subfamily
MDPSSQTARSEAPALADDLALVQRLQARDREAFASLIDRYHRSLFRLARMYVATDAVAEEVVQETWMGVLSGLGTFEGRSSLKTWLFRILTNRAKTRGAREARSVPFAMNEPEEEGDPAVDPTRFLPNDMWGSPPRPWEDDTPEKLLADREAVAFVARAIDALPARQRIVITLRDVEGLDAEEVRNVLGVSETNQRVLLHRARSRVRNDLERYLAGG